MALAQVHAAEFTLLDPEGPTTSNVAGRLTSSTTHSGTELISFTAGDAVSGVYRSFLEVDGQVVKTAIVDANGGRCADAGVDASSPYEFLYRVPCLKTVQHDVSLDTTSLVDGSHVVRVLVEDAAGNRTAVFSNPDFEVRNAATAGGPGAIGGAGTAGGAGAGASTAAADGVPCIGSASGLSARFARNDERRLTVKHGQAFAVTGRAPANAEIDVFHIRGRRVSALGSFRATSAGTFHHRLSARHGNGTIQLCGPGMTTKLDLRVKATVSFRVRISNWGLVRYSGRVATGQIPRGGKIVVVQGKAGPNWQTFALRRTDRQGRFKGRYRLRVVYPGTKLKFRVRVPGEAGYPFIGVVGKALTRRVR